jgi:glycosyltransferase involved in cell wall biosynthesis
MMALRVTTEEQAYFDAVVRPLVQSIKNLAKFVGEVDGAEKDELIGRAGAVLFPSPWEEPFGLVMAEASARGTPVIALARGAAPELIVDGVTGILCADEEEMVRAVPHALALDPAACRAQAERLFERTQIARQHLEIYASVLGIEPSVGNGLVVEHPPRAVLTPQKRAAGDLWRQEPTGTAKG